MMCVRTTALAALAALAIAAGCAGSGTHSAHSPAAGDLERGKATFSANCAVCHGATGVEAGTLGPSLRHERSRMDARATMSWIKDPAPPMPALFPKFLSDRDVTDVATYVQSL
jgi:mono/diheme cytochrome c family protein